VSASFAGLSTEELRATVRAVLREVLPEAVAQARTAPTNGTEQVAIRSNADLDALVKRVAELCEDASQRSALRAGRRRFRLAETDPAGVPAVSAATVPAPSAAGVPAPSAAGVPAPSAAGVMRVESGAVTERKIQQAAKAGGRLVIGRKAVLTPLARDRARNLGVVVERER